jgi:hypothetical protein
MVVQMSQPPRTHPLIEWRRHSVSIVPVLPGQKRPALEWAEYQHRRATPAEVSAWVHRWPDAGVGIVCGRVSGLFVVDIDPRNGGDVSVARFDLGRGPLVDTGGGGLHAYYASPAPPAKITGLLAGVDLQGEGSLVVVPPSMHASGRRYRFREGRALGEVPLPPGPFWLRELLRQHRADLLRTEAQARGPCPQLDEVLARLTGVRKVRRGWLARCPGHADTAPSLSVAVGDKGKLLLYCFGGCTFRQIVAALEAAR